MLPLAPAVQEWLAELAQAPYHAVQWPEWYGQTVATAVALASDGRTLLLTPAWTAELAAAGIAAADAKASVLAKPTITTVNIEWIGLMDS